MLSGTLSHCKLNKNALRICALFFQEETLGVFSGIPTHSSAKSFHLFISTSSSPSPTPLQAAERRRLPTPSRRRV